MAEHVWTVLCGKVLTDPDSGTTISLMDVTERLTLHVKEEGLVEKLIVDARAEGDKGILVSAGLTLVSWWVRSDFLKPESTHLRYAVVNPGGDRIHEEAYQVDLDTFTSNRIVIKMKEFPVSALGRHWIVIEKEPVGPGQRTRWKEVARLPLELVESVTPPP